MKRFLWFIFLMIFVAQAQAQNEVIREEIENAPDSRILLIHKGRNLLLEKLKSGDYQKVKEVKDYLVEELDDKNYLALYVPEYWLILFWTQEYDELLKNIRMRNDPEFLGFNSQSRNYLSPLRDLLYFELLEKSANSSLLLEMFIEKTELDASDKQFLSMLLKYLIMGEKGDQNITQENLNVYADDFLKQYPNSDYNDFVKKYISDKQTPGKWGLGWEISGGGLILTDNLGKSFKNGGSYGFSLDIYYQKLAFYLRLVGASGKNKLEKTLPENEELLWEKDASVSVFMPEFSLGYVVFDNRHFSIAPFAGISSTSFSPVSKDTEENPDMKKFKFNAATYVAGVNLDLKFPSSPSHKRQHSNMYYGNYSPFMESVSTIRIRYSYRMPQFENKYGPDFSGNMHNITIGFAFMYRALKRSN